MLIDAFCPHIRTHNNASTRLRATHARNLTDIAKPNSKVVRRTKFLNEKTLLRKFEPNQLQ